MMTKTFTLVTAMIIITDNSLKKEKKQTYKYLLNVNPQKQNHIANLLPKLCYRVLKTRPKRPICPHRAQKLSQVYINFVGPADSPDPWRRRIPGKVPNIDLPCPKIPGTRQCFLRPQCPAIRKWKMAAKINSTMSIISIVLIPAGPPHWDWARHTSLSRHVKPSIQNWQKFIKEIGVGFANLFFPRQITKILSANMVSSI